MPTSEQIQVPLLFVVHTQPKPDSYFSGYSEIWVTPCYFENHQFLSFSNLDTWEYGDRCYDGLRLHANIYG
jgi:hypothetical protein